MGKTWPGDLAGGDGNRGERGGIDSTKKVLKTIKNHVILFYIYMVTMLPAKTEDYITKTPVPEKPPF